MADDAIILENEFGRAVYSPLAGASLRSLRVVSGAERFELISGGDGEYDPTVVEDGTGCFLMAPWPNRIRDGELYLDGHVIARLPINSGRHAIHGLVKDREWTIVARSETQVRMDIELAEPWPFAGAVEYEARLEGPSLVQSFWAIGREGTRYPFGFGWHPWFRRDLGNGPVVIHVPEQELAWELDEEMTAIGRQLEPAGAADLRDPVIPKVGSLDHCFRVIPGSTSFLGWHDGPTLAISSSRNVSHLQIYTPEHAICVEPQTCAVDAFRLSAEGHEGTGALIVSDQTPVTGWTRWTWG